MQTQTSEDPNPQAHGARYFRPRRIGHVNLIVSSMEASMRFYNLVIGLEEAYRVVAIKGGFLSNGNTHHDIGMIESSGPAGRGRKPGLNHLAFELETEVDLVNGYNRAIEEGMTFQRTLDHDIAHSAYVDDPDGNSCELYADVIRDWRNARTGSVTKPKPVWWPGLTEPHSERNYDPEPEIQRVDEALFHPARTKHATLIVENLNTSIDFYTEKIGLDLIARHDGGSYALLGGTCGERNIALVQAQPDGAAGLHHVGMEITDEAELDASLSRLRTEKSIEYFVIDHPVRRAIYLKDPDGLLLQLFVDRAAGNEDWSCLDPQLALWLL
ncbi:MAG: VOC family protein [Pusillimonas sp.]